MSRHLPPGHVARLFSFATWVATLKAKFAAQLLAETPDQDVQARAWGDRQRDRRAS